MQVEAKTEFGLPGGWLHDHSSISLVIIRIESSKTRYEHNVDIYMQLLVNHLAFLDS